MRTKRLLILLPFMVLVTGCDAKASAENFYNSAKEVFEGKIVDPLLDRIDGGYREINPETQFEKARRLFCEAVSSPNSYFELTKTIGDESFYSVYVFADSKFNELSYSNYDGMKEKVEDDVLTSVIYTNDFSYRKSETGWDKTPSSETTLVDFSSFNPISKMIFGQGLVEFATPLDFVLQNGKYTCTGPASVTYDQNTYASYTSTWFLTVTLDSDALKLKSFTLSTRINYKLKDSEEVVGKTITYSGNCVSLRGNSIVVPTIEGEEQA